MTVPGDRGYDDAVTALRSHIEDRRRRRGRDVLLVLLVVVVVLAVLSAAVWLAEHLTVLAGAAPLIWGAFHLGHLHERRRARPDQA